MSTINGRLCRQGKSEWIVKSQRLDYRIQDDTSTLNANDDGSNVCAELLTPATANEPGIVSLISILP